MAGETKKFLDSAGLQTFLTNLKNAYAGNDAAGSLFTVALASKANALSAARTISLTGDVTGSTTWDGSGNLSIATTTDADTNVIENIGWKQSGETSTITWITPETVGTGDNAKQKAVVLDLSAYALKSDMTRVMRFKGTCTSDALASTTGMEIGDVYSIIAGGEGSTYKVGSEYAWDGSSWTELGATIDLSGYVEKTTTVNSKALSSNIVLDGSDIALSTSYAAASTVAAPATGDSIDVAIGKLQKEIVDANASVTTYAFAEGTTNGAFQVTPSTGGVAGTPQSVAIHGLGSAAYADTTAFVSSTLAPAEAGAQVNVIEGITINGASTGVTVANKIADLTITADVADVQISTDGTTYATVLDANKIAKIDLSSYALASDIPEAATSIADGATGYATGDQVYDYVEANKGDENVIEEIQVNGTTVAPASKVVNIAAVTDVQTKTTAAGSYASVVSNGVAQIDLSGVPTPATAIADGDAGYATGDQVYDYIEALPISDATINGLFGIS